ncbi:OsmC family protein [Zunongwangia sp.]|uniref:OsmC family protein n=1 Tax=Zunongwangia sp. TaxID=1965325 RepID=UPI003AA88D16
MIRKASAIWKGTLKEGEGNLTTESGILNKTQYSYKTRFEDGNGTNPEELVGAAHSGCFTMQLSAFLAEDDFPADQLETRSEITFEDGEISKSHLILEGKVPGISEEKFKEIANKAKESCPLSKLLDTEITLDAKLLS